MVRELEVEYWVADDARDSACKTDKSRQLAVPQCQHVRHVRSLGTARDKCVSQAVRCRRQFTTVISLVGDKRHPRPTLVTQQHQQLSEKWAPSLSPPVLRTVISLQMELLPSSSSVTANNCLQARCNLTPNARFHRTTGLLSPKWQHGIKFIYLLFCSIQRDSMWSKLLCGALRRYILWWPKRFWHVLRCDSVKALAEPLITDHQ